jgi:SAM-dependent methyltransferase
MKPEWYESFFTALALDFWQAAVPAASTVDEVDFLIRELGVSPPERLLDLPSGLGRHALVLARRGYEVTGIDLSSYAIASTQEQTRGRGLPVTFLHGDMRHPPPGGPYDGAFCFGNSFGYLSRDDTGRFARNILTALRPGRRWAIDTGAVAESLLRDLPAQRTLEAGGVTYEVQSRYDAESKRLLQSCTLVRNGEREFTEISYTVYTVAELLELLVDVGFKLLGSYGSLDGRPFEPGDRRLFLVAQRPS